MQWYNDEHRHSAIRYVTPAERHAGADQAILAARHHLYQAANRKTPARWSRWTRNWTPIAAVTLNPERAETILAASRKERASGTMAANVLSGSADAPAFPPRPDITKAAARNAGDGRRTRITQVYYEIRAATTLTLTGVRSRYSWL